VITCTTPWRTVNPGQLYASINTELTFKLGTHSYSATVQLESLMEANPALTVTADLVDIPYFDAVPTGLQGTGGILATLKITDSNDDRFYRGSSGSLCMLSIPPTNGNSLGLPIAFDIMAAQRELLEGVGYCSFNLDSVMAYGAALPVTTSDGLPLRLSMFLPNPPASLNPTGLVGGTWVHQDIQNGVAFDKSHNTTVMSVDKAPNSLYATTSFNRDDKYCEQRTFSPQVRTSLA